MLHFLTDEHISPAVAEQARRKCPGIRITPLHDWKDGYFLGTSDAVFIPEAIKEELTLVTYDLKTIPPLFKRWMEEGLEHSGVVFVDEKSITPQDFGGLVAALVQLWKSEKQANWDNRVIFLKSAK